MSGIQLFTTLGLPAIAISASLLALWVGKRSAARIDEAEAQAARSVVRH